MPQQPKKRLRRLPGHVTRAELSLAVPWASFRADPNGYYELLGLDPGKAWFQSDIKRAFREKARLYHPDGSLPDAEKYDRLQVAYAVLQDDKLRQQYDLLYADDLWPDKFVLADYVKQVAKKTNITPNLVEQFEKKLKDSILEGLTPILTPKLSNAPQYDNPVIYYYEGDDIPPADYQQRWFDTIVQQMWLLGFKHEEVRLGFTDEAPRVIDRPWGKIMMVSGEPNPYIAFVLVWETFRT